MTDTLARIRLLTGDDPFWNQQNPLLLKGEVGFRNVEGEDPLMKVGDGVRRWLDLPNMNKSGTPGLTGPAGPQGAQGEPGVPGTRGPIGEPGNAQSPWRQPFSIASTNGFPGLPDFVVAQFGVETGAPPNYLPHPVDNSSGHVGPYAWWFSPSEQWGLEPGGRVLEMHHWWPRPLGAGDTFAVATYFSVDGPNGPMIEILPGGSGRLGAHGNEVIDGVVTGYVNSATLYWGSGEAVMGEIGWGGGFTIIGPRSWMFGLSGGTLNTFGNGSVSFNSNQGVPMGYTCYISNHTPTQPGNNACNVLRVSGGWDRSDVTLRVGDGNYPTNIKLDVRGDGAIFIDPTRATSWPFNVGWQSDGQLVVQSSSRRYKTNIHTATRERAREILSRLRLVSFSSLLPDDDPDHVGYGLIAEEVAEVEPTLASFSKDGKPESVRYQEIVLLLLPLMQEVLGMEEPSYG